MCDRAVSLRRGTAMSAALAALVAARLPESVREVMISGGEPTVWPHLALLAGRLVKRGFRVSLQTNGTHPETVVQMMDIGVTHFNLSVDGPRAVHDRIRGDGVFDKAIECIHSIRARKCSVVTTTVLSASNLGEAPSLIGVLRRLHAKPQVMLFELERRFDAECLTNSSALVGCDPVAMGVRISESAMPSYSVESLARSVSKIRAMALSYRQKVLFLPAYLESDLTILHSRTNRRRPLVCGHRRVLRIDPAGRVIPCFTFRTPLGDLSRQAVETIVEQAEWIRFWTALERRNLTPACETCFRAQPATGGDFG
jgi:radical SAM protein with 4Fe4S-binding SPASM domain